MAIGRKKNRKSHEILIILMRLFDVYFILKNLMKSIKIHPKKESIEFCILLNTIRHFFTL